MFTFFTKYIYPFLRSNCLHNSSLIGSTPFDVNVVSPIGHVETDFKNRMLLYDINKVITCKTFFIEPTQRGGVNEIYNDI